MDPPNPSTATAPHNVSSNSSAGLSQEPSTSEHRSSPDPAATAAAALSQEKSPTPEVLINGKKRKATITPGSRGVANLTPEQLAKKRANDREAQRAIRERTRNTIGTLESRIRELESQQPYQDLQRAIQERDRAIAECEEYRRRLVAIVGIAGGTQQQQQQQQHQQQPSLTELAALTAQQSPLPLPNLVSSLQHQDAQPYQQPREMSYQEHALPDLNSPGSTAHARSPAKIDAVGCTHQPEAGDLRRWSAGQSYPTPQSTGASFEHHVSAVATTGPGHSGHGDRLELNFLLDTPRQRSVRSTASPSYTSPTIHAQLPLYARMTSLSEPSCPLDSLLIDFHTSRRKMLREGTATPLEAVGPSYPFFATIAYPEIPHQGNCHPLSSLMLDILSKFPDISRRPEKVAVYFIMFLVMQWTICPCEKCYERLPDWCRPVSEQYERPHVVWADYLPWPFMRSHICYHSVEFNDFFVPYTTTLSLNWHLPNDCVLISIPRTDSDGPPNVIMNPAFEHHLRDLRNWSLGAEFRETFPQLVNHTVNIKDRT